MCCIPQTLFFYGQNPAYFTDRIRNRIRYEQQRSVVKIFLRTKIISKQRKIGLMDKIQAKKLHKPLFYLPLQAFEKMNKKSAFTVVVK